MKRSGKIRLLFWLFVVSLFLYLWIVWIAVATFILPETPPLEFPADRVGMMFILYGILIFTSLAGVVISIFINNGRYMKLFSALVMTIFATIMAGKGLFG
jgi:hypothetical protein